jgi:hypothetical protein
MVVFALIYAAGFFYALREVLARRYEQILVFFLLSLPLYITALSTLHQAGLGVLVPVFQYSKEIIIVITLAMLVFQLDALPKLNLLDKLVLAYFMWNLLYVFLPLGSFGIYDKLIAFKNVSFFPFIYFIGRLIDPEKIWIAKWQSWILVLTIAAGVVILFEAISSTHLQTFTGYAEYYRKYFGVDPTGNYGLSWTFEIEGGARRFASFFANPLELAAATLLSGAVLVAMFINNKIEEPRLFQAALLFSIVCVVFALSRASLAGYFMASYLFFLINGNKKILWIYHGLFIVVALVFVYFLANDIIGEFILNTFTFTNTSSLSHLIEWIDGIEAIGRSPMGLGLGESGRVAGELGLNVGGENQIIIIGVQAGVVAILLYVLMYVVTIGWSAKLFLKGDGKAQQLGIMLFILKIGMIVPVLTAAVESYLYISAMGWFLVGLLSTAYASYLQKQQR